MKTFRSLLAVTSIVAMIAIMPTASAQVGTATLISAKGDVSQVATQDVATLTDFFGTGSTVNVKAFAGFGFRDGRAEGGLAVSNRTPISRELFADLGLYGRFRQGRASDGGLFIGFGWRF